MPYQILLLLLGLIVIVPLQGIAAFPSSPSELSTPHCKQPVTDEKNVIVGPHPLRVIVTKVDEDNATIDFISEVGTLLQVTQASTEDLKELHVGDAVELCIIEELHGEEEI